MPETSFSQIYREQTVRAMKEINEPRAIVVFMLLLVLVDFDERHPQFATARASYSVLMNLLNWTKTPVGNAVRYLIAKGFITKVANGCYRIENLPHYLRGIRKASGVPHIERAVPRPEQRVPRPEPRVPNNEPPVPLKGHLAERYRQFLASKSQSGIGENVSGGS